MAEVKAGGVHRVNMEGTDVEFSLDDLLISSSSAEGFVAESDNGITVVLDTNLTPALIMEGVERELISKIQTMRKEAGFEVTDRIEVYYTAEGNAAKALAAGGGIAKVVLADRIAEGPAEGFTREQDVNGERCTLTVVKKA